MNVEMKETRIQAHEVTSDVQPQVLGQNSKTLSHLVAVGLQRALERQKSQSLVSTQAVCDSANRS